MTKQTIFTGSRDNDGTGDKLRVAFTKINDNFNELYGNLQGVIPNIIGNNGKFLSNDGTDLTWSIIITDRLTNGNSTITIDSSGNLHLPANGDIYIGDSVISHTVNAVVSDTAPSSPFEGMMWYDTDSGRLYVYYDNTWADANPRGSLSVITQATRASNDTGTPGQISFDSNYIYVCVAQNVWKRSPLNGY